MLNLEKISKHFAGVQALRDVSIAFEHSSVHAVCGENGAGKSTLMNIIMGNLQPDAGKIFWRGTETKIRNVLAAQTLGISIVYQERSLVHSLTIAENIFPVNAPVKKTGIIDFKKLYSRTRQLLNDLGLDDLSPVTKTGRLSPAQQQMIEIAKAIAQNRSLLILDEPTASLTHRETKILFDILRKLKEAGVGIIYITHRMWEISQIADVVSVLKDGRLMGTIPGDTPSGELIRMMVGRSLEPIEHSGGATNDLMMEVREISGRGFKSVSFRLYKGEILGFAGLQGSGRTSLGLALFGDESIDKGSVWKKGNMLEFNHPQRAMEKGIAYIPDDRKSEGLFLKKSIAENVFSSRLRKGMFNENDVNRDALNLCKVFGIRMTSVKQEVHALSGGNQQKVMLAKWMALEPDILIVNEPTHGVDIAAKAEIYDLLKKMSLQGRSIILISSDLPELLLLSDRIAVMREGMIDSILPRKDATEEKIVAIASGITDL